MHMIRYTRRGGTARTLNVRGEKIYGAGIHWDVPADLEDDFLQIPSIQKLVATGSLMREPVAMSDDAAGVAQPAPAASSEPIEEEQAEEIEVVELDQLPETITKTQFCDLAEASGISRKDAKLAAEDIPGAEKIGNSWNIPTAAANAWINENLPVSEE